MLRICPFVLLWNRVVLVLFALLAACACFGPLLDSAKTSGSDSLVLCACLCVSDTLVPLDVLFSLLVTKIKMADSAWLTLPVPISIMADSYKPSHYMMYPDCQEMIAYGEFRAPMNGDKKDTRFVCYGMRYIVERYLMHQWTQHDLDMAEKFYSTHNVGGQAFPFPRDLFSKFITENKGYFPIKLEILPEGTVANVRVPVYQITAKGEYARLVTFFETILTHVWYPSCVATLSRRVKESIKEGFDRSVSASRSFLLDSRLHDFGFRGTTCVEQSIIGGTAHLLNFTGSDTMSAAYYAQFVLNGGRPIATVRTPHLLSSLFSHQLGWISKWEHTWTVQLS